jgi:hypothetical protein
MFLTQIRKFFLHEYVRIPQQLTAFLFDILALPHRPTQIILQLMLSLFQSKAKIKLVCGFLFFLFAFLLEKELHVTGGAYSTSLINSNELNV